MRFRSALCFFTRLPVGVSSGTPSFQGVVIWLPVVGLIVGLLVGLAVWSVALFLPAALCGALGCLAWVAITGGLHLDGVADCGDGLLVEASARRRLEIMKDSRLGAFGGISLFFILLLKIAALGALSASLRPDWDSLLSLLGVCCLAAVLGRSAVFIALRTPSARPDGMGRASGDGVKGRHGLLALALCLALCLLNGVHGLMALAGALLTAWLLLRAARKRLGGVTGDVFGCLIELTECVVLVVFCLQ